ncbi:hypothetical protein F5879DRAFT_588383 [Lentinula edodes]|nr:hypothetical protein F5879DRAFT_588383 [Lentinula edodes]
MFCFLMAKCSIPNLTFSFFLGIFFRLDLSEVFFSCLMLLTLLVYVLCKYVCAPVVISSLPCTMEKIARLPK